MATSSLSEPIKWGAYVLCLGFGSEFYVALGSALAWEERDNLVLPGNSARKSLILVTEKQSYWGQLLFHATKGWHLVGLLGPELLVFLWLYERT